MEENFTINELLELIELKEQRESISNDISKAKNGEAKSKKLNELNKSKNDLQNELKEAQDTLLEMDKPDEIGQQKKYIQELEKKIASIQKDIDAEKSEIIEQLNKKLSTIQKKENKLKEALNNKIEEEIENIENTIEYCKSQIEDLEESIKMADESQKEVFEQALAEAKEQLAYEQEKKEKISNIDLEELLKRAECVKELVDNINDENKKLQEEIDNDLYTRTNQGKLKKNQELLKMIEKDVFDNNLDYKSLQKKAKVLLNNFKRKNQVINVGGYEMTRGQALEELTSLYSRLEDEPDLDSIDDPDYNKQAILDRIAQLEEALGISQEIEDPEGPRPEPPGPDPDPTKKLPVKSGLQIFREQFNQMDEIKRRHTASERAPFYQTALAVGGIAALTAANLPLAVSMFVAAPVLKPALKLVTGQSALEKNIADQFRNLKNTNPEEFDRMVDYLSEEKIQDLKPNAVILNALHKVSKERTAELIKDFKEETDSLERARKELLSKKTDELTDQDRHALEHINERLIEINEGSRYIDDDGNERFKEGLAQMAQRRYKELKRGKDRVSQRYKGNLLTRFNIFAHRNSDSKTYKGPLNELANAELARDKGILSGNDIDAATEQQRMDEIMSKNTHTNFLGVQNSVFNDRRAGKTGPIRLISDMLDNTYKNVLTIAAMAGTILTAKGIVSKAKVNNIGNKDLAQKAANAEQSNTYATAETAAIRKEGVGGSAKYLEMDAKANQIGDQAGTTINENSLSGQLRQLGDQISKGMEARKMLQSASQGRVGYKGYVADHSNQIALQTDLVKNEEARGKILKTAADLIDKVEQNGNEIVKKAFIGPIAAGIGALHRVASGIVNNYKEHKDKSEASGR